MNKKVKAILYIFIWFLSTALVTYLYNLNNKRLTGVYETYSNENYARLKLLLNEYHGDHGNYPPRLYQRKSGEPYHSWRILLLAYMPNEASGIYNKYDFSQEWNSSVNLKVIGNYMPKDYYVHYSDNPSPKTPYLAYDFENEWPFDGWMRSCVYKNGNDKFIIIESPDSDVHWAEPRF